MQVKCSTNVIILGVFTSVLITGCSNKKDYETQINHYVNNTPACVSIPFNPVSWTSGEMPNDDVSVKISIPRTNLDDEKLSRYNKKIEAMDTLVKLGFFKKGDTKDVKDDFFHSESIRTTYTVTDIGLKQFDENDSGKPQFGQLCFGSIKVDNITDPTKSIYGDLTGEDVNYNWKIEFSQSYAKDPVFIKGFDILSSGTNTVFFTPEKNGGFIAFSVNNNQINMMNSWQMRGFSGQLNQNLSQSFDDDF